MKDWQAVLVILGCVLLPLGWAWVGLGSKAKWRDSIGLVITGLVLLGFAAVVAYSQWQKYRS